MNRKFRFTIRWKLQLFALAAILIFGIITYGLVLPAVEREKRTEREAKLRAMVQAAVSLMDYYEDGIRSYRYQHDPLFPRTRAEAQEAVLKNLSATRYEHDECVFVLDGSGTMVMHPLKPSLTGADMREVTAFDRTTPFRTMVLQAMRDRETFVHYTWLSKWSLSVYEPQTSYARYFYPWNWVVCSSVYTQDITDAVRATTLRTTISLAGGVAAGWFILYLISLLISRPILALSRQVRAVSAHLDDLESQDISIRSSDEIGDLAGSFRTLLTRLKTVVRGLRESEENLSTTLNSIGDAVIATDTSGRIVRMNPVAEELTGWHFDEAKGKPLEEVFVVIDSQTGRPAENPFTRVLESGEPVRFATHTALLARDASRKQIAESGAPIRDSSGNVAGVVLVFRDVSEEYRMREEQRRSEEWFRTVYDNVNDAIFIHDAVTGIIVDINQRALDMFGYTEKPEIVGRSMAKISSGEEPYTEAEAGKRIRLAVVSSHPQPFEWSGRRKDGTVFWIEVNLKGIVLLGEKRILAVVRDIDERKQLEERLRHTEKMEAIGQLAGGIAHDFNNQLTGALGFADLLRSELHHNPELEEMARQVVGAIERSAGLTAQLLAFARKGKAQNIPVDIHQIIGEVISLLSHSIHKNIKIATSLKAGLTQTSGDPNQLQNAFLNLALNARDAMPKGGTLKFATKTVVLDRASCEALPFKISPGQFIRISVSDTGDGIAEEHLGRIFEPFFTTKDPGKGTGMGLASVFGTVSSHGGALEVKSAEGTGSTFSVLLPVTQPDNDAVSTSDLQGIVEGTGHILVVDDEKSAREGCAFIIRHLGYTVTPLSAGAEAVAYYRTHASEVDIVILDMVMPDMDGPEVFSALRDISQNVQVILTSGYTFNVDIQELINKGARAFLHKPYTVEQLSTVLAEVLEKPASQK